MIGGPTSLKSMTRFRLMVRLCKMGVITSFNSDSSELACRMNIEAAKAVKYGGLSEEEALKFVTINPAKQLRIEDRVGSIEPGKDADLVIWSGDPFSVYSIAEKVFIDGALAYDYFQDSSQPVTDFDLGILNPTSERIVQ